MSSLPNSETKKPNLKKLIGELESSLDKVQESGFSFEDLFYKSNDDKLMAYTIQNGSQKQLPSLKTKVSKTHQWKVSDGETILDITDILTIEDITIKEKVVKTDRNEKRKIRGILSKNKPENTYKIVDFQHEEGDIYELSMANQEGTIKTYRFNFKQKRILGVQEKSEQLQIEEKFVREKYDPEINALRKYESEPQYSCAEQAYAEALFKLARKKVKAKMNKRFGSTIDCLIYSQFVTSEDNENETKEISMDKHKYSLDDKMTRTMLKPEGKVLLFDIKMSRRNALVAVNPTTMEVTPIIKYNKNTIITIEQDSNNVLTIYDVSNCINETNKKELKRFDLSTVYHSS